jgi:flagellar assembly protein FliH
MASIIRSPDISQEKRKLTSRRTRAGGAQAVAEAFPVSLPQAAAAPAFAPLPPAQVKPVAGPDPKLLFEQARLSVLEQFKHEGEQARELGRQRGLQEGRASGAEEARKSGDAELARLRTLSAGLGRTLEAQLGGVEGMAVAIAFEAVCKILGAAAVTREGIAALVRQAASHAVHTEKVAARLHPSDLELLRDAGALDATLPSGMRINWVADASVVLGGCVLETDSGELDARLETQMERLRSTLLAARGARP